ncbi:MAG TPA: hypothetical protein VLX92_09295 [Kofleriaceae bacterium]|nr:hypothetical protein [Kofleriaceae bacterium]
MTSRAWRWHARRNHAAAMTRFDRLWEPLAVVIAAAVILLRTL